MKVVLNSIIMIYKVIFEIISKTKVVTSVFMLVLIIDSCRNIETVDKSNDFKIENVMEYLSIEKIDRMPYLYHFQSIGSYPEMLILHNIEKGINSDFVIESFRKVEKVERVCTIRESSEKEFLLFEDNIEQFLKKMNTSNFQYFNVNNSKAVILFSEDYLIVDLIVKKHNNYVKLNYEVKVPVGVKLKWENCRSDMIYLKEYIPFVG